MFKRISERFDTATRAKLRSLTYCSSFPTFVMYSAIESHTFCIYDNKIYLVFKVIAIKIFKTFISR